MEINILLQFNALAIHWRSSTLKEGTNECEEHLILLDCAVYYHGHGYAFKESLPIEFINLRVSYGYSITQYAYSG